MKTHIIGFLCDWCSRATADTLEPLPDAIKILSSGCTGRVDPLFLIRAYLHGADGVLVAGCEPGRCHYKDGNYHARRRMALLKQIFTELDLDVERLHIEWVPNTQPRLITEIATRFAAQIEEQGPNDLRSEIFV